MKVNSFFCGAGGFDLGFIQAGFEITGAWDFDKYAVQSYRHNIGDHVQQADVSKMKGSDIPKANGWLFGFPCQDISVAGKQKGMIKGETRSGLFYEIMRLLEEVEDKPDWILAENVKAVNKFIPEIEKEYDIVGHDLVLPQLYNSKYWGVPQNRERYFLLGLRKDLNKSFVFPEQQTDFIPKLSSVLETDVDEKYYMSNEKAKTIIEKVLETGKLFTDKDGAAYCIDANYYKGVGPSAVGKGKRTQVIVHNIYGGFNEKEPRIFEDYAPTIRTAAGGGHIPSVMEQTPEWRIRKLTPRETARLQGFPDSYEQVVSDTQFYKQMGNAVTVNVAYVIAKAIKEQLG